MKQRILTGVIFGIVVITMMFAHDLSRLVLLILIPILAGYEYLKISGAAILEIVCALIICIGFYFALDQLMNFDNQYLLMGVVTVNIILAINLFVDPAFIKHQKSRLAISVVYIGLPFVYAIYHGFHDEPTTLVTMMALIWISDSGAYFVGSQIGKRKLFPRISPGKTWEGFLGAGMLCCLSAYFIFSALGYADFGSSIRFALIVWLAGTIGDLIASQVKRLNKVKDSSNILPGHGGFYDRFDSLIYALPFVFLFG